MVYCEGCGDPLAMGVKFCQKCGHEATSAPRSMPASEMRREGLDPSRFKVTAGSGTTVTTVVTTTHTAGPTATGSGGLNPALVGRYEYVKPSSWEKSTQTLELRADGSCSYKEVASTNMENYETTGDGKWDVSGGVVRVNLPALVKNMKFKTKPLVPGIGDGSATMTNVAIPIHEEELLNAPKFGSNKWRIAQ
mmetsp:Transcript_13121/g.52333  ORF Transcript_13121/g.52333 Transcript_13121/m.52333 type:complete len:193 (+) Transcript_13121:52-630(+)